MVERRVRFDADGEAAEHVRAVREPGDLAEALGLALGAEAAAGHVEAFQGLVVLRIDLDLGLEREGGGHVGDGQKLAVDGALVLGQRAAVDGDRDRLQPLAVELQRLGVIAVAADLQLRLHPRRVRREVEAKMDLVDQVGRRAIVGKLDGLGGLGSHGGVLGRPIGRRKGGAAAKPRLEPRKTRKAADGRVDPTCKEPGRKAGSPQRSTSTQRVVRS